MEQEKLDPNKSLEIITEMIQSTRYQLGRDKFIYLMWGYLVLVSAVAHYILGYMAGIHEAYWVWLTMPVGGIISGIYYGRMDRNASVKTFTDRVLSAIWIAFIMALIIFLISATMIGWNIIYPVLMVMYGVGTFSSGRILQFKPLWIGGVLSMLVGAIAFHQPMQVQLLLMATAVLVSYVIPGHMLPKASK
jgi:hypothetical protein